MRLLFYFKKSLTGIDPYKLDLEGLQKVQSFRQNLKARGVLYRDFNSTEEFTDLVKTHLFDLIATEWRTDADAWTSVDAPAQPSLPEQTRPSAVVDTKGGNAAKPKNRTSEPKKGALPDEDDLEDPDRDGLGLLDHVENLNSVTNAMTTTFESMSGHIKLVVCPRNDFTLAASGRRLAETPDFTGDCGRECRSAAKVELQTCSSDTPLVGEKISRRTKEIGEVQQSQARSRTADGTTQQRNVSKFKHIINGAADDIDEFVGDLAQDVNIYRSDNRVMLSEVRSLLEARRELGDRTNSDQEMETLRSLIETMRTVKGQVDGFQESMQEAPALTGKFRSARRRGVSMLGELIAEISFSIDETEDILKNFGNTGDSDVSPPKA